MKVKLWEKADFALLIRGLNVADRKKRHDTRYACFRMQTHCAGGNKAEKSHIAITKKIEKLNGFEGWRKFALTWDVSTVSPIKLVKRKWSIYEEWNQTIKRVAEPLPGEGNGRKGNV